jgi:hypothetical protein
VLTDFGLSALGFSACVFGVMVTLILGSCAFRYGTNRKLPIKKAIINRHSSVLFLFMYLLLETGLKLV